MEVTEKVEHDEKIGEVRRSMRFARRGDARDELKKEVERLEEVRSEYLRNDGSWCDWKSNDGPWNRYAIYPNGKIHEQVWGCRGRIQHNAIWLVDLSGSTVAEVIEEYGSQVCSRCFKDAPIS
jgi:hypothetical protein